MDTNQTEAPVANRILDLSTIVLDPTDKKNLLETLGLTDEDTTHMAKVFQKATEEVINEPEKETYTNREIITKVLPQLTPMQVFYFAVRGMSEAIERSVGRDEDDLSQLPDGLAELVKGLGGKAQVIRIGRQ